MTDALLVACALALFLAGAHVLYSGWVLRRFPAEGERVAVRGRPQHHTTHGHGPAVALVHGANGVHHDFPPELVQPLAQHHRVLVVDRPGHGHSARLPGQSGLEAHSESLRAVLRAGADGPAVLVGHSYGALVVLRAALDEPALVRGVIAVTPAFSTDPRNRRWGLLAAAGLLGALGAWLLALPVALGAAPWVRRDAWHPATPPRGFGASRAFPLRPAQMLTASDDLRRLGEDLAALRADLPGLTAPLTVIAGESDRITPWRAHARLMHEAVPGSRWVAVPDGGHWLLRQFPDVVIREVEALSAPASPRGAPSSPATPRG